MKKIFLLCLSLFTVILFSSCESTKVENVGADKNQSNVILLKGNPSTGYDWEYSESKTGIIEISLTQQYLGDDNIVGAPSLYRYELSAVKDGKLTLTFEYKRSWEKKAIEKIKYSVEVKDSVVTISKIE